MNCRIFHDSNVYLEPLLFNLFYLDLLVFTAYLVQLKNTEGFIESEWESLHL